MFRKITRRRFLQGALASAGLTLAACAPAAPEPTKAPAPTAAAQPTKAPEPTKAPAPTAAPAAAPTSFSESPTLAKLVKDGKLPPLAERLPKNPYVSKDAWSVGQYSTQTLTLGGYDPIPDTPYTLFVAADFNKYLWQMHENMVQWTIDENLAYAPLKDLKFEPNLAERWEVSQDGKVVTFYLRQGVKWSDGVPFTVDDILFTWNDVVLGGVINSPWCAQLQGLFKEGSPTTFGGTLAKAGGVPVFEKIDAHTFRVVMQQSFPEIVNLFFGPKAYGSVPWLPKHQMEKVHPKYNPKATVSDWAGARMPGQKPAVLGPWAPVAAVGNKLLFERNPYYYKVDAAGNQLPYFDGFSIFYYKSVSEVTLGLASGELWGDFNSAVSQESSVVKANEQKGNYKLIPFPKALGVYEGLRVNLDTPNASLRSLFQNADFVKALSLGLDTDRIAQHTCQICRAHRSMFSVATLKAYPQYADLYTEKFDRTQAMAMLDKMGLQDTNGDGYREYPKGTPDAGKPIGWLLVAPISDWQRVRHIEDAGEQFNQMGFKVTVNPMDEKLMEGKLISTGEYEMAGYSQFLTAYWTDEETFKAAIRAGGSLPMFPKAAGEPNPLLERTKSADVWDWQKEGMAIRDAYLAGKMSFDEARDKYAAWLAANTPRFAFGRAGVGMACVVSNRLQNVPYNHIPAIRETGLMPGYPYAGWDNHNVMRWWQWWAK